MVSVFSVNVQIMSLVKVELKEVGLRYSIRDLKRGNLLKEELLKGLLLYAYVVGKYFILPLYTRATHWNSALNKYIIYTLYLRMTRKSN